MPGKQTTPHPNESTSNSVDPLFLQAEHLAKDFSLFPDRNLATPASNMEGMLDEDQIQTNLDIIKNLDVDAYINRTVQPAQSNKRPGAKKIISMLNGKIVREIHQGPFYCAEMDLDFGDGFRRIGFIAQERSSANGSWMPEHHDLASVTIHNFSELALPIVYLIDTPGADAGELANSNNQAHSISRMIAESANVNVPTVGIIIGIGYSGGAIPLATANILLSARDGIFNTIQPQGLQSITRKFNLSWQECAKYVGVSPEELYTAGCIDGVINYSPMDRDERQNNLQKAITSSIRAIESASMEFVGKEPDLLVHYQRSLGRFITPSSRLQALEGASRLMLATSPTTHLSVFGLCYRYMRYLSLRSRIHSMSESQYGRLSQLTIPEGDLQVRMQEEQDKALRAWLDNPDRLVYDEPLNKAWQNFISKRNDVGIERNVLTRFILGEPKENYDKAREDLLFNLCMSLYNRWKTAAANNFSNLIHYLEDETGNPVTSVLPEPNQITVIDVISHTELREAFITHCHNVLIFDAMYDTAVNNLESIAREAMNQKSLSQESVRRLLQKSLDTALNKLGEKRSEQTEADFSHWLKYFLSQSNSGDLLLKVEQWKSIGFPQLNDSLFVILTHYFERLLPEYFASTDGDSAYKGTINPVRIGRRKDFWNRLTMGYRDLLIQDLLRSEKAKGNNGADQILNHFFTNFVELDGDLMTANLLGFPGFRPSIENALNNDIKPCGLITGLADFTLTEGKQQRAGIAVSNIAFQAGAFDMASAEKFCSLLVECARQRLPVICFISSGGMQTKEGAAALFSMAIVNDRLTRFIRDNELPVVMFGYGDCTGGAQASFVTHPLAQTYYLSGTNMPFAGQRVVPAYLPSTSTLSNYLSRVPGTMAALVKNPFSSDLDDRLIEIDPGIPLPALTIEEVISRALAGFVPDSSEQDIEVSEIDPVDLMHPVKKVLIHARGCTAVKLIRKAHESNINVVLVASDPDMTAVPADMLKENDKLVCLGGSTSDESYLNAYSVLQVAEHEQVDALHPGIGFLSESPQFANLCVNNKINFIGPTMHTMATMGNKSNAIKTSQSLNVPVVPGSHGILGSAEQAANIAREMGYPVLLKAVQGGGGKGIQVVENPDDMFGYFQQVSTEARAAFGNGDLYLEKYVTSLRHIEVQLLRDKFGNTKVLGLRDCTVQRNNQKVLEESGSTMLPPELRQQVMDYTRALADAVNYTGAGTVEYIFDLDANAVYFMEMNTRLQVEHPVTEATSGIDIVKAQYAIASGKSIEALEPTDRGYAIEVRVTAEMAAHDATGIQLVPNPGKIVYCEMPERDDMEIISIAATGKEVTPYYDSLIAQIICYGESREDVTNKLHDYLGQVQIQGIATNIPLIRLILKDETFTQGVYDTTYLPKLMARLDADALITEMKATAVTAEIDSASLKVDNSDELKVVAQSAGVFYTAPSPDDDNYVIENDVVTTGQTLGLMEAMKMFSQVTLNDFNQQGVELYPSSEKYRIEKIMYSSGQQVSIGDVLFIVKPV